MPSNWLRPRSLHIRKVSTRGLCSLVASRTRPLKINRELNTFYEETRRAFMENLAWLNQWACARSYGLGSKPPWDSKLFVGGFIGFDDLHGILDYRPLPIYFY
ncbi:hypothetical protein HOY82DRAFT_144739 [Tuber indicum]|nr:hypothetical protein HOY82DRAFT_144739 [Tuber indicum]